MRNLRKSYRILMIVAAVVFILSAAAPTSSKAQQTDSGGVIIEANAGGDPKNLNPLLTSDTSSQRIIGFLFPALINVDPKAGNYAPNVPGGLAKKWEISEDGLTYTFHLRNDWKWSDGQPITAKDYKFSYDAVVSGKVDSPLTGNTQDRIASVETPDDYTVVVKFKSQSCTALADISNVVPLPAHVFKPDFSDLNDQSTYNTNPNVTAGPFKFKSFVPSQAVTLVADQTYPDVLQGKVKPDGYIYKSVPDQTVSIEQFLAGETNVIDNPQVGRRADIDKAKNAGKVQVYKFPGNSWEFIAWNLADPKNPQSAVDDKGNLTNVDQGHHPLFGDVRVRRALAMATDVDSMIKTVLFGEGQRLPSLIIPSSWAYDKTLQPIPFNLEQAGKMLDEAGFPKGPDGLRVAKGAKYAKDGTPFKFTLLTNADNARRKSAGTVFQAQMKAIGVTVDFQPIEFNTMLDRENAQDFDAILAGWRQGFPDDPDPTSLMTPANDIVGSGYDFVSYNNPELTKLISDALHVKGCAQADRAQIYAKVQKIIQDDQPYEFLYVINGEYAANSSIAGFEPLPSQLYWNVDAWTVKSK